MLSLIGKSQNQQDYKMDLYYITNSVKMALKAEKCGVDRIMVDLEIEGKKERQGHLDTVISNHSIEDIYKIRASISKSKIVVRINPISKKSKEEIDNVIMAGADIIMLPMFRTYSDVKLFLDFVNSRVKVCLLLETYEAYKNLNKIISLENIDEIHVGLNDLHLSMKLKFMFELLSNGIIEDISRKVINRKIKFGFGGIARIGEGMLDSSLILSEHIRLNSSMVILSRDFKSNDCNLEKEIKKIRDLVFDYKTSNNHLLLKNRSKLNRKIYNITSK